jgi:Mg/Co/Ni transporter MgtE
MNLVAPVSSIMAKDVETVTPKDSISRVADIFERTKAFYIPVIKYNKVVGMINRANFQSFCRVFKQLTGSKAPLKDFNGHTVSEVMEGVPMTLEGCDRIAVAVEAFRNNEFVALPVVDRHHLIGLLTTHEVIEALAKERMEEVYYSIF